MIALGGGVVPLSASNVVMNAYLGSTSAPTESTASTPGHLPGEHLSSSLTSFDSMNNGELCANVSAASMAAVGVPQSVLNANCAEGFTSSNTLLDVLVRGCKAYGLITVFSPTPKADQVDPAAPAAGACGPYTFTLTGNSVTGCKDTSGTAVDLSKCQAAAAYSVFFKFTSDRVILK
jgi:hypothetical protein